MNNYKVLRLTTPMKLCGDFSTMETFKSAEDMYKTLTLEYIEKPLTCELVYSGGLYAIVSLDENGNYKATEIILEMLKNKIRGFRKVTTSDELKVAKFFGAE